MSKFHYYDLETSEVFTFEEFLINQIKQGSVIKPYHNEQLKAVIDTHFKDKPMAYISNRVASYSVDLLTYKETEKIENLVAMAIILGSEDMAKNANFEKNFYHKPYGIFTNLADAIEWSIARVKEYKNKL